MSHWKLYHNPQCSKSREALSLLQTQGIEFHVVEYIKTPPSIAELRELIDQLMDPISSLVRVKESEYLETPFDVTSKEEVIQHLAQKPRLMERPILQGEGRAVIGRPLEKLTELVNKSGG